MGETGGERAGREVKINDSRKETEMDLGRETEIDHSPRQIHYFASNKKTVKVKVLVNLTSLSSWC